MRSTILTVAGIYVLAMFAFGPYVWIWLMNKVSPTEIPYNVTTWVVSILVLVVFYWIAGKDEDNDNDDTEQS